MASVTDLASLFDMLTRHQVYLEGVKLWQARQFNVVMRELDKEFRELFARLQYNRLDDLTRGKVKAFVRELNEVQWKVYSVYTNSLLRAFNEFMEADYDVSSYLFETDTDKSIDEASEDDDGEPIFPWLIGSDDPMKRLWSEVTNSPLPANGLLLLPFVNGFATSAAKSVENIIMKGYANGDTTSAILAEIIGTKDANFRDGAFARINAQNSAVIDTALQHVSSVVQAGIASIFYRRYRWVSVIDSSTTEICRSRNGKIYEYGKGPLPPAHIRCRSKTVPVSVGSTPNDDEPRSYYAWIKAQPAAVQDDVLGSTKAERLRSGKAKANDFARFDAVNPLSIEEFKGKRSLMTTG